MTITKKAVNFTKKKGAEMTADERIEKLLNRFGQTIEDLPKPKQYGPYSSTSRRNYYHAAREWTDWDSRMPNMALTDYGCHLCDVIDRLEIALETALTQLEDDCDKCSTYDCQGSCRDFFRLRDELLIDPELEIDDVD